MIDLKLRHKALSALEAHAKGEIEKHVYNVEILLTNPQGVAEHPGQIETIQKELDNISIHQERLDIISKYF
tara:strand:- start:1508 stop:1720 length:213 start_codon:yes stop_codon:yes gene_type:complete